MNMKTSFPRRLVWVRVTATIVSMMFLVQHALATPVVVDVFDGVNPQKIAAKYGITPDQIFSEVTNGFSADVTSNEIKALDADKDVQEVRADRDVARIIPPHIRVLNQRGRGLPGAEPYTPPQQPAQAITPMILRVNGTLSRTADIDGRDDKRVNADIAIMDGGVDPYHPDLNVVGGFDCVRGPANERGWSDRDGHGTMVAGMAAAVDNKIGIVGTAPGARIWSIRVSNPEGIVKDSAFICGLEHVLRNKHVKVINMSFAGDDNPPGAPCVDRRHWRKAKFGTQINQIDKEHELICRIVAKGITIVAAAGNDYSDVTRYTPAAYPEVIAVSGIVDFDGKPGGLSTPPEFCYPTDVDDTFAVFSNYGAKIDIAAVAVCIESTYPGGLYAIADGTSFASPMVAGAAALLYARYPGITPAQVRAAIRGHAQHGQISSDPDGIDEGVLDVSSF